MRARSCVCVLVTLAGLTGATLFSSNAVAGAKTSATVYEAFSYHGLIVPHVQVKSGYCWVSSGVTRRDDAWRCFVGNTIYDPCFSSEFAGGVVVCPIPWANAGTEIQLTKPLPMTVGHTAPSGKLQPWAIQTASGADCVLASVAGPPPIHGRHLNYFCGANAKVGLWGFPDRRFQPWTIFSAPVNATALSRRVAIRHAWM